jgi:protein phosphatase
VWARQIQVNAAQRHEGLDLARRLLAAGLESTTANAYEQLRKEATMKLRTAARTDIGRVRENNEDAVLCLDRLVAVADGMGGCPGGEVASSLAISILEAAFTGASLDELEAVVRAANRAIVERGAASPQLEGMGTTLCAVGLTGDGDVAVVNVGDSRAYLVRDGAMRQLTDDHSVTAELLRRGELTEEEALDHPHRNVLTRVLGAGPTIDVDGAIHATVAGDRLLLCTDGLFNEVPEPDITSLMTTTDDVAGTADALVERAVSNGGRDNIAVVIAEFCA